MNDKKEYIPFDDEDSQLTEQGNLRTILENAIRTQALFSGRRITIVQSSSRTN